MTKTYHVRVKIDGQWQNMGYYSAISAYAAQCAAAFEANIAILGNEWDIKEV